MSQALSNSISNLTQRFYSLSWQKQIGFLFGISIGIAVLFAASMTVHLPTNQPTAVVPTVHSDSQQALPKKINDSKMTGLDLLGAEQNFGVSQFVETARYWHAIELELAKTISDFDAVRNARVHLALPKSSAFLRDKGNPTASVLVELTEGKELGAMQVNAIKKLVASSVPHLNSDNVTVVANTGYLLPYDHPEKTIPLSATQSIPIAPPKQTVAVSDNPKHSGLARLIFPVFIGLSAFVLLLFGRFIMVHFVKKPVVEKPITETTDQFSRLAFNRMKHQGQWRQLNKMASEDPQHIARVIKQWVGDER